MTYKSKTLATWIALIGGSLGLHRFYLHGFRDPWGWLFAWPKTWCSLAASSALFKPSRPLAPVIRTRRFRTACLPTGVSKRS